LYKNIGKINTKKGDTMEFTNFYPILSRSLISLLTLFLVAKMIGKKQVSELSVFDYVIGISIGNFAAEMIINLDSPEIDGIFAVLIFGVVAYLVSFLTMKSMFLRRVFIGTPTIVLQDGKLLKTNMKKLKLDVNDLLQEARRKGYFNLSELQYGVMEVNGEMSFLPYPEYRPATVKDINKKPEVGTLYANVIVDGEIMANNLNNMGKTEDWLRQELSVKGYKELKDILLCIVDNNGKLSIYTGNETMQALNVLE